MTTNPPEDAAAARNRAVFSAAADHFDDEALAFFARISADAVDRLALTPGQRVLDVACGTGHAAIPAARAVGPAGTVTGADLAEPLLALARAKAAAEGLSQADFVAGDFRTLPYPDGAFDAVICVFGIFFVPDMEAATAELWRMVAPGGRLALTTWGPDLFAPLSETFWTAVRTELPPDTPAGSPASRLETPEALHALFTAAEVDGAVDAVAVPGTHPLRDADDWWTIVIGSGMRGAVEQIGPEAAARVRAACAARVEADGITQIPTNVVHAVATRPA
ncbi:MAG: methyltransferase domain-containing protein [Actinobacteria bacterium]|nr:methyltransferase domain-containing protein [Actinomycetota bacterium]